MVANPPLRCVLAALALVAASACSRSPGRPREASTGIEAPRDAQSSHDAAPPPRKLALPWVIDLLIPRRELEALLVVPDGVVAVAEREVVRISDDGAIEARYDAKDATLSPTAVVTSEGVVVVLEMRKHFVTVIGLDGRSLQVKWKNDRHHTSIQSAVIAGPDTGITVLTPVGSGRASLRTLDTAGVESLPTSIDLGHAAGMPSTAGLVSADRALSIGVSRAFECVVARIAPGATTVSAEPVSAGLRAVGCRSRRAGDALHVSFQVDEQTYLARVTERGTTPAVATPFGRGTSAPLADLLIAARDRELVWAPVSDLTAEQRQPLPHEDYARIKDHAAAGDGRRAFVAWVQEHGPLKSLRVARVVIDPS